MLSLLARLRTVFILTSKIDDLLHCLLLWWYTTFFLHDSSVPHLFYHLKKTTFKGVFLTYFTPLNIFLMGCFMKGVLFLRMYFLGCIIFEDVFFKGVFNLRVFIQYRKTPDKSWEPVFSLSYLPGVLIA